MTALTQSAVDGFVRDGYLVAEGLINSDELTQLKADIVAIARGRYDTPRLEAIPDAMTDSEALERILCVHQPHFASDTIASFTTHPAIASILGQILGAHLGDWWDGSVNCMQSMFFVKPPGKPGQAWHQDEIYIPTRDRSLCGAWIAVDDATVDNGCLWVLPGSHRQGRLYPQREHGLPEEFDFAGESYGFDDSEEIPVEVPAGSVVFFNGYLLHRSRINRSDGYRRALVNHYCSGQTRLPWFQTEHHGSVATADNRCTLHVAGPNPDPRREALSPEAVHLRHYDTADQQPTG